MVQTLFYYLVMKDLKYLLLFVFMFACDVFVMGKGVSEMFQDATLRVDIVFKGETSKENVSVAGIYRNEGWTGKVIKEVSDESIQKGDFLYSLVDCATSDIIWRDGFCTLYDEYLHSEWKSKRPRAFEHSILMPMPRKKSVLILYNRNWDGDNVEILRDTIDVLRVASCTTNLNPNVKVLKNSGNPKENLDILILADAYTASEQGKFDKVAADLSNRWLNRSPWNRFKNNISVRTAFIASDTNSVGDERDTVNIKHTVLGSRFGWLDSDRYLINNSIFKQMDYIGTIPADIIVVAVNTREYGGGGVYNEITTISADHPSALELILHEAGHSFVGLADEYFCDYEDMENYFNTSIEPWQPNVTTLKEFEKKWKNSYEQGTTGLHEGAAYHTRGMYRSSENCLMRELSVPFCKVCEGELEKSIEEYIVSNK